MISDTIANKSGERKREPAEAVAYRAIHSLKVMQKNLRFSQLVGFFWPYWHVARSYLAQVNQKHYFPFGRHQALSFQTSFFAVFNRLVLQLIHNLFRQILFLKSALNWDFLRLNLITDKLIKSEFLWNQLENDNFQTCS